MTARSPPRPRARSPERWMTRTICRSRRSASARTLLRARTSWTLASSRARLGSRVPQRLQHRSPPVPNGWLAGRTWQIQTRKTRRRRRGLRRHRSWKTKRKWALRPHPRQRPPLPPHLPRRLRRRARTSGARREKCSRSSSGWRLRWQVHQRNFRRRRPGTRLARQKHPRKTRIGGCSSITSSSGDPRLPHGGSRGLAMSGGTSPRAAGGRTSSRGTAAQLVQLLKEPSF
mmetsp:Transcript_74785/g.197089  ORF Transcript_74785/g.197089 Transcript_74785/m.197089 type:complete len:230 (+) Transcript_74785:281-970(+)